MEMTWMKARSFLLLLRSYQVGIDRDQGQHLVPAHLAPGTVRWRPLMLDKLTATSLGLLVLFITSAAPGQTPAPATGRPTTPALRMLTGDDARRAEELDEAIEAALKADRWDEAIARIQELVALRTRVQGPSQFETVNEEWLLKALRRVAPMPKQDRVACQSATSGGTSCGVVYSRQTPRENSVGPSLAQSQEPAGQRRRPYPRGRWGQPEGSVSPLIR
jgi:hypothetical protein